MRHVTFAAILAVTVGAMPSVLAQHDQHHGPRNAHRHGHTTAQPAKQPDNHHVVPEDTRIFVKFPAPMVEHTLANMRDHLMALQEIQENLGIGDTKAAARIAEARLGMSSLGLHNAHEVAKFMPKGMQEAGTSMHQAASRFAIVATDSAVTGDLKPVFTALSKVTAACVGCHAGYRIK